MLKRLRIDAMHERHRALTPSLSGSYHEAAAVCLSRHHTPPVAITLSDNGVESSADVAWDVPDERILDAWANATDTTEVGAYGCVIAGVEETRGLVAVRRAETGTGADYYVGLPGSGTLDLEDCLRLEVSGVDEGDQKDITKRLHRKIQQARDGRSSLPAITGVIGFAARLLIVQDVEGAP